ncbi:UNVERIFIED_CONTAM: hypothetical protein K2H54_056842 [Gekko kuhli]
MTSEIKEFGGGCRNRNPQSESMILYRPSKRLPDGVVEAGCSHAANITSCNPCRQGRATGPVSGVKRACISRSFVLGLEEACFSSSAFTIRTIWSAKEDISSDGEIVDFSAMASSGDGTDLGSKSASEGASNAETPMTARYRGSVLKEIGAELVPHERNDGAENDLLTSSASRCQPSVSAEAKVTTGAKSTSTPQNHCRHASLSWAAKNALAPFASFLPFLPEAQIPLEAGKPAEWPGPERPSAPNKQREA